MLTLYGFVNIANFIDNVPGQTSTVGEITAHSATYSSEKGLYRIQDYPDVSLMTFDVRRDGQKVDLNLAYYSITLQISQWLYTRSIQGLIGKDTTGLLQALNTQFATIAEFRSVGEIVTHRNYNFPSSIQYRISTAGEENEVYIWYADANFRTEYPNFEIDVVPPVDDIDLLMGSGNDVLDILKAITVKSHSDRIQAKIGDQPQTEIWTGNFTWVDRTNDEVRYLAPFTAIIRGFAGSNLDHIKDALREYILSNSKYGRDEWEKVLPDLFTPTEFYLVPIWDRYSLPNQIESTGLYSPTVPVKDIPVYSAKYFVGYDPAHVAENSCISGSTYQNIAFLSCGHIRNYAVGSNFDALWPQYAAISTDSPEFSKIPPATREFIIAMVALFKAAEKATATSVIPTGMTRTVRGGIYYLTTTVGAVQYLAPIKNGFSKD
ncbi:virion-associated protein [Serratia phage Moabite]|uniref:Virion-associated protein n=3 Tax=Moabitevirus TaxID=2843422 RepID=A0A4Y5TPB1_9CAUD|nr:virion structural protein [Serratia phage vB_SmaM_ 2050HW]YP_009849250.1 virion structural protein [Serratia phage Moabite]QPX76668.1 putative virion structural protein [Serratia phage vB_SmaM_Yaphecito]UCR74686.1 virion structural protein [Serratia phage BUCT660]UQT03550.1 putative virion structural protein [Serratia phage vB_SmaM-Kodama]URG14254.1 virion structural protein [Pectobacterium phage vB_ParM-25]ATA65407.1 virion structural protein [Serratia phage vB_SmaM_ 2050HW]